MEVGSLKVRVVKKDIKNIHLSVYPPDGSVRVATPRNVKEDTLRLFVVSKIGWIRRQQRRFRAQDRETKKEMVSRESHYFLGKRYLLKIIEVDQAPSIEISNKYIVMRVRLGTPLEKKRNLLDKWYRTELKQIIGELILKAERKMHLRVNAWSVRQMKTKWGSCSIDAKRISFNIELAKKPIECIEFIIVHEMVHLLERTHNERFINHMNMFMPQWELHKRNLNKLPICQFASPF